MRQKGKKSIKLPDLNERNISYALQSINVVMNGCYDDSRRLRMDEGFGDYNMRLFRLKDKKKYVRTIPSAFTPSIRRLLEYSPNDPHEKRIATEHNQQIEKILGEPKEVYLDIIRKEREAEQQRRAEEMRRNEFVKGEDAEVREHNEQLSFNYLPKYQANQWFSVVDRSPNYVSPTPFSFNTSAFSFATTPPKTKARRGHIFLSDDKSRSFVKRKG